MLLALTLRRCMPPGREQVIMLLPPLFSAGARHALCCCFLSALFAALVALARHAMPRHAILKAAWQWVKKVVVMLRHAAVVARLSCAIQLRACRLACCLERKRRERGRERERSADHCPD